MRASYYPPGNAGSRRHPGWGTPLAPRSGSGIRPTRLSDDGKREADSLLDPGRWSRRSAVSWSDGSPEGHANARPHSTSIRGPCPCTFAENRSTIIVPVGTVIDVELSTQQWSL